MLFFDVGLEARFGTKRRPRVIQGNDFSGARGAPPKEAGSTPPVLMSLGHEPFGAPRFPKIFLNLGLSCLVLSCLVLSCLVLSCFVFSCLVLSCLALQRHH